MKCPACSVDLLMTERQGVEIDYCPKCRGVWLDRGELDKLIERSAESQAPVQQQNVAPQPTVIVEQRRPDYRYRDDDYYKYKKRKSLLGEIFDF